MTSHWAEEVAARLDEAAEMIQAFDLASPDEVAGLISSASVLQRSATTLATEERAASGRQPRTGHGSLGRVLDSTNG
jgi:hypothetical protein